MKYICSVYSLDHVSDSYLDICAREERFRYACLRAGQFMQEGLHVYSPIAHNHVIAKQVELPKTWEFWEKLDVASIDLCDEVYVLMMPGWERSTGITAEIAYAESKGLPITYFTCEDYQGL